ncbi:MAG: Hsp20/alpha crystallin family protein [Candidatus Bathyarchaeota archaeon]|nr:Hsp20/alpha crystallin family protein [Candidatus Bathyarchaeota archaeon]
MSERKRPVLTPGACFDHNLENYYIEVELPGVDKGHIEVSVSEQSICVVGSREDVDLLGCWYLGHSVNEDKAKAKYENGMLYVTIPLKKPLKGKKIPIE